MNILPKKNWHVRTKKNIERVRKDEAQAAEEEKERLRKIALAESEARTDILRDRARKRTLESDSAGSTEVEPSHQKEVVAGTSHGSHINFFKELEEGTKNDKKGNKEYEEEKRQEKEKQEKAIGLLTYLGQSAVESQTAKPWYFKPPEKKSKTSEETTQKDRAKDEFDTKMKRSLDPMSSMTKYIEKTKKVQKHRSKDDDFSREKRHKHKKHKKHKDEPDSSSAPRLKTIEQLRAERLRREKEERERTEKLMAKLRGEKIPGETKDEPTDERERRYNSQFNPDLVRTKKARRDPLY